MVKLLQLTMMFQACMILLGCGQPYVRCTEEQTDQPFHDPIEFVYQHADTFHLKSNLIMDVSSYLSKGTIYFAELKANELSIFKFNTEPTRKLEKISTFKGAGIEYPNFTVVDPNNAYHVVTSTGEIYHLKFNEEEITLVDRLSFATSIEGHYKNKLILEAIKGVYVYDLDTKEDTLLKHRSYLGLNPYIEARVVGPNLYFAGQVEPNDTASKIVCYDLDNSLKVKWSVKLPFHEIKQMFITDTVITISANGDRLEKHLVQISTNGAVLGSIRYDQSLIMNINVDEQGQVYVRSDYGFSKKSLGLSSTLWTIPLETDERFNSIIPIDNKVIVYGTCSALLLNGENGDTVSTYKEYSDRDFEYYEWNDRVYIQGIYISYYP